MELELWSWVRSRDQIMFSFIRNVAADFGLTNQTHWSTFGSCLFWQILARFWLDSGDLFGCSLRFNPSAGLNSSLCYARGWGSGSEPDLHLWLHNLPLVYNVWFCSTVRFLPCCHNLLVNIVRFLLTFRIWPSALLYGIHLPTRLLKANFGWFWVAKISRWPP